MTLTPAALAVASTAAPEVASIESMTRTDTPSPIMLWAIDWYLLVLPPAFWMSDLMPAASKAFLSRGVSNSV